MPWAHSVPAVATSTGGDLSLANVSVRFMGYRWVDPDHDYFAALLYYHMTEWFIVFGSGIYLLSFAAEFWHVRVQLPVIFFAMHPTGSNTDVEAEPKLLKLAGEQQQSSHHVDSNCEIDVYCTPLHSMHHSRQPSDQSYVRFHQELISKMGQAKLEKHASCGAIT